MELWDIIDINRNSLGRTHMRGQPMIPGDYHLVVHIWIISSDGRILLTRRTPNKDFPLYWEITGGSAVSGDTSIGAALREVKEETGLTLDPKKGYVIRESIEETAIVDIWVFEQDFDIADVTLQDGETCDAKWASADEVEALIQSGRFVPVCDAVNDILAITRKKAAAYADHSL